MFTIVANGTGGQVNVGDSIYFANNQYFQGGLFATGNVEYSNNSNSDGPILGSQILLANNVVTNSFPNITTDPVGMPGNPPSSRSRTRRSSSAAEPQPRPCARR